MSRQAIVETCVFVLLVAFAIVARVCLRDVPNFAPVSAVALFSGYFFRHQVIALMVPLLVMASSDWIIDAGGYAWPLKVTVYGLLALPVCLRAPLRRWLPLNPHAGRVSKWGSLGGLLGCSLACSLVFFVGTNAMVWMLGGWYEPTWAGLAHCFARALPFFRYTLGGDATFGLLLFGSYAFASAAGRSLPEIRATEPASGWHSAS